MSQTESVPMTILRAPFEARTWRELAYLLVGLVLGTLGIAYLWLGFGAGLFFAITLVGIPVLAGTILGGRVWGHIYRWLCEYLLQSPVEVPAPFRPKPGFFNFIKAGLTDRVGWRGILYLVAKSVIGVVLAYFVLLFVVISAFVAISPIPWWLANPQNIDSNGVAHHSLVQFGDMYIETWPATLAFAALGVVCVFLAPWPVRALVALDKALVHALLGQTDYDKRVRQLQDTRTTAVEDSAATLRRVERDLHDGTQARLVTMAMALGRAEEKIASGDDASSLISDAHANAKDALRELRELVRGIHPPALDLGLPHALETLASRSAVPVDLNVALPVRPTHGIEAIAYFSVAELLTNVAKHANASAAWLNVATIDDDLVITLRDNGTGGADPIAGTGLTGLAARASTVDGSLNVVSPGGGPTVVTIALPMSGSR
ncbi:sensor histidine kinase [Antrihabitans cavernicola]|uniref:histidine kinase n=1 Tax=Antrihabitans cavernicola TaxID=2495913 RepID=A0A5A7S470_9NOCA|nr:sensor domain-containing protein [Spelaeibacter cavernicola]KAA0018974.1 sensor histidine kinase [Spelaeibacter cavernicola]